VHPAVVYPSRTSVEASVHRKRRENKFGKFFKVSQVFHFPKFPKFSFWHPCTTAKC